MATIDIAEMWTTAEATAYSRLLEATGATDGDSAFLGAEPPGVVNYWTLFTGGGDTQQMDAGVYSVLTFDAEWVGVYAERADCQANACRVLALLDETSNLFHVGNVEFLRPVENPTAPVLLPETAETPPAWRIILPLWFGIATTVYT